jgi:uncharacterized membrane protein
MKLKFLLSVLCLFIISNTLFSQLYFKNNTSEPVWVAFSKWNDSKTEDHWYTKGWYKVDPGATEELASGIGHQDYCYFFAETAQQKKKYEGDAALLVNRADAFTIKNADKQYKKDSNDDFEWANFRKYTYKRDILGTKVKQTIILTY